MKRTLFLIKVVFVVIVIGIFNIEQINSETIQAGSTGRCKVTFMKSSAIYKWQVVAKDSNGAKTEGPIWTFVTEQGSSGCAAESVLADDPESLSLLRQFRDDVLAKSEKGKALIKLYYEKSPLIVELIEKDPALKEKCRETLKAIMPSIRKIVNNNGDLRN